MNRLFKIVGGAVLVAVVGFAFLGAVVNAQDAAPTQAPGAISDYVDQMWNTLAEKLGVQRSTLDTAVKDAQTDVAAKAVEDGALTQDQADKWLARPLEGFGFGRGGRMHGFRGGMGGCMGGDKTAVAEALGMSVDDLTAELQAGKTLDEVAQEKGVDLQAVRTDAMKARIQQAVVDGKLTQEQADWMLEGIDNGLTPEMGGFGGHHGFEGFGLGKGRWFDGDVKPNGQQDDQTVVPSSLSHL